MIIYIVIICIFFFALDNEIRLLFFLAELQFCVQLEAFLKLKQLFQAKGSLGRLTRTGRAALGKQPYSCWPSVALSLKRLKI